MNSRTHSLRASALRFTEAGIEEASLEARLLLQYALGISHEALVRDGDAKMSEAQQAAYEALINRRLAHEPIAYILGYRDFWKDRFTVTPATLIPRADSEAVIELALEIMPPNDAPKDIEILDLCTGTGCLLLSLLREYEKAFGMGGDISLAAISVAKKNAIQLGLDKRAAFFCGDMSKTLATRYDLVVCNPPYIAPEEVAMLETQVRSYEPHLALKAGEAGLAYYKELSRTLPRIMKESAITIFEIGAGQEDAVNALMQKHFENIGSKRDLGGHIRALAFGKRS